MKKMLFFTIMAIVACGAFAANNIWTDGGDGVSWDDPSNWSLGVPTNNPLDTAFIGYNGENFHYSVVMDTIAEAYEFKVGIPETVGGSSYLLDVESTAYFELTRLFIGRRGTLNLNGGDINIVGNHSTSFNVWEGVLNINGGELTVPNGGWRIKDLGVVGTVNLNGGVLRIHNGTSFSSFQHADGRNNEFTGIIDLRGGQLTMDGDCRVSLQKHIDALNIRAFGSLARTGIRMDYDSVAKTTTMYATGNSWTGDGDGVSWSDAANWALGVVPVYNTDDSMLTYIGVGGEDEIYDVTIDGAAESGRTWVGIPETAGGSYTLSVESGGYYELVRLYLGKRGTLNINGGDMEFTGNNGDAFVVGGSTVNINSGSLTVGNSAWRIVNDSVNIGTVNLYGGELRILNGTKFSNYSSNLLTNPNTEFKGVIDVYDGQLVMDGDCRTALQWHINNGNIIADGDSGDYKVEMVYSSSNNTTTLFTVDSASATYIWPSNGMELTVDDRYTFQLNWQAGELATDIDGYNVYVADSNSVPLALVSDAITPYTGTTWQITDAVLGAEYSWRIDTVLADGAGVVPGMVWTVKIGSQLLSVYDNIQQDGSFHSLDWQWIACGDGVSWKDELNWHSEVAGVPIPAYTGHEGKRSASLMPGVIDISGGNNYAGNIWVGLESNSQTINVKDNAYWQLFRIYGSSHTTINIEKGSVCQWFIPVMWGSVINLEGEMRFTSSQYLTLGKVGSRGTIKISNGGELWFTNEALATTATPFNDGEVGNIDIYDGTLKVQGDNVSIVSDWVDAGHIIAYGNNEPNSIVDVYYDAQLNQTFATARQDKHQAYQGYPHNAINVAADAQLSWIVGDEVDSDALYMAVVPEGDLNRDDAVDIDDLLIVAANFLDDSWFGVRAADIGADYEVNLRDFAQIGADWLEPITYQQIATFTRDPNNGDIGPGELFTYDATLDYDTEYRWRVDSNADEVYASEVWTFKTGANPNLAFNQYPVNGDMNITETTVAFEWELPAGISSADVYFGNSHSEVVNATTSSAAYKTTTSSGTWTTPALDVSTRYYWRIDTLEGATTHKGKVWTFKTTDSPMGLYVDGGVLKLGGSEFKGYGVNYIDAFAKKLANAGDTSYEEGFATLAAYDIPFVRMWGSSFYVNNWALYFENKEQYFELFDEVMAAAAENEVGVIISAFWAWYTLPDVVGQTITDWADPTSEVSLFMENYIREIYQRYKNNPYFWGWELGNEYNYSAENEHLAPANLIAQGHPTVRTEADRTSITKVRAISANFASAVRKVDKNRIVTNGFGIRLDATTGEYGSLPERYEDHEYSDVASIHYYPTGSDITSVATALADTAGWDKPLFVGEFGVSETNPVGFATVEAAFTDTIDGMRNAGVTFAAVWVYNYSNQDGSWNITATNNRSYMLDQLQSANAALNQ